MKRTSEQITEPILQQQKTDRKSLFLIIYIFLGMFVLLMGYYTYFLAVKSSDIINSSYNKRQDILAQRVIRGEILSADGEVLAKTAVDEDGKETREYPYGKVFANVVGKLYQGVTGIEGTENIYLLTSDINPLEKAYHDLVGIKSSGNNVVTTLDTKLQQIAYDALGDYRGAVIVMEPATGKILAMVSKPAYDPNTLAEDWEELIKDEDDEAPLLNRATQGVYPPGSTFKVLTSLEYMRENPDYKKYEYECDGSIEYDGMVIHDNHNTAHGEVNLMMSFAKSCNPSFSNIGKSLDLDRFHSLCEDFLFNSYLPISIANSKSSFTLQKSGGSAREAMQTAIGQGNTVITPMENALIVSTIANGGVMMRPYVIDHTENPYGSTQQKYSSKAITTPMTAEEADYLAKMMRKVVTDGTAKDLKDLSVKVAGKTGSADHGEGRAHSWFIGYAPYNKPKIAVSIIAENAGTGSEYAVPIAEKIFKAYFD